METAKLCLKMQSAHEGSVRLLGVLIDAFLKTFFVDEENGKLVAKLVGLKFAHMRFQRTKDGQPQLYRAVVEVYFKSDIAVGSANVLGEELILALNRAKEMYKEKTCCEQHRGIGNATFGMAVVEISMTKMLDDFKKSLLEVDQKNQKTMSGEPLLTEEDLTAQIRKQFPDAEVVFVDSIEEATKYMKAHDAAAVPSRDNPNMN